MAKKSCKNDVPTFSRQGDVGFLKVEALPEGLVEQKNPILVEGEVTGHAHRVEEISAARILSASAGAMLYLQVVKPVRIVHDEHHPITLDPGYYQIVRQREYSPEAIRTVID